MSYEPVLSVIIPVYNVAPYLDGCLQSVCGQKVSSMQILLVNDASTDDCGALCEAWQKKDARVQVLTHTQNRGLSAARNTGLAAANGKYVTFVDSDDAVAAGTFNTLIEVLEANAEVDVVEYPINVYEGHPTRNSYLRFPKNELLTYDEWLCQRGYEHAYACNKMFRHHLWQTHRFLEGKYFEDLFAIPVVMREARTIMYYGKGLYHYYYREGAITAQPNVLKLLHRFEAFEQMYQTLCERLGDNHVVTQCCYLTMCNIQILLNALGGPQMLKHRSVSLWALRKAHLPATALLKAIGNNLFGNKFCAIWPNIIEKHDKQ